MLDHLQKNEFVVKRINLQNEAEIIYQQFLVKGRYIALKARQFYLEGGIKKVRKFARSLVPNKQ
jgi:hypothetical protein